MTSPERQERIRCFVALGVPAGIRDALTDALEPLRAAAPGLRWPRPEGWHLTLAFLGDVEQERLRPLAHELRHRLAMTTPPRPRLRLAGAGRFDRRVLWVGVDDVPPGFLASLAGCVREAAEATGLALENRPFRPHLTVARSGTSGVGASLVEDLQRQLAALDDGSTDVVDGGRLPRSWTPSHVEVWQSHLSDRRAIYTALERIALRGPPPATTATGYPV